MDDERDKAKGNPYRRVRVEGTKDGLVAHITSSAIVTESEVLELGNDLMSLVQLADSIDMPVCVSFRGVERISSALIGTVVLVNKMLKEAGQSLKLREMSPQVEEVFRRLGGGGAGSAAVA